MPQSCPEPTLDVAGNEILVTLRGDKLHSESEAALQVRAKDFMQDDDPCVNVTSAEFLEWPGSSPSLRR